MTIASPIVAMNSDIGGWFASGRRTSRSTRSASSAITARVATIASQNGRPRSTRLTNVSAANSTIAPCAKLNTPDAL